MHKRFWKLPKISGIILLSGIILAGLFATTIISPRLIPYNMDEFISYQEVGCVQRPHGVPNSIENIALESCMKYDLRLPKTHTWLPLRTYSYIGSISGLFYAPFYLMFHSSFSVRMQGYVFFLIATWLMSRFLRVRYAYILLASLVFVPFFFSFVVDTGPIGFSMILLMTILLMVQSLSPITSANQRKRDVYLLICGALAFLGFWIKPSFAWWLPAILIYIGYLFYDRSKGLDQNAKILFRQWLPFFISFIPLSTILLLTLDRDGDAYYAYLNALDFRVHNVAEVLTNLNKLTPRVFDANHISSVALTLGTGIRDYMPAVLFGGLLLWWSRQKNKDKRPLGLLAAAASVFFISVMSDGVATHHAALTTVFLVMTLALIITKLPRSALLVLAAVLGIFWINLIMRIHSQGIVYYRTNVAKDQLLSEVQSKYRQPTTAFLSVSAGTYFINNVIAAPNMAVWYYNVEASPVSELTTRLGRQPQNGVKNVVVLVADPDKQLVRNSFDLRFGPPKATVEKDNWAAYTYSLAK